MFVQNGIPLDPGHTLQIIPQLRFADQSETWTGIGFVKVMDGAGLVFNVDNLPSSTKYKLVIRYEPQVMKTFGCWLCFSSWLIVFIR